MSSHTNSALGPGAQLGDVLAVAVVGAAEICSLKALGHSSSNVLGQQHSLETSGSDPVKMHSKERRKRTADSNREQMSPGGISHTALLLCCKGNRLREANNHRTIGIARDLCRSTRPSFH